MAPFFLIFLYVLSSPNLFLTTAQETAAVESVVEECVSCDNVLEAERGKFEGLLEKEREECTSKLSNLESSLTSTSQSQSKTLQEKLTTSESSYATCSTTLTKTESDLTHSQSKIETVKTDLNAIIDEKITKLAEAEVEKKKLGAKIHDLNEIVADLRKELKDMESPTVGTGVNKYCNTTLLQTDALLWYNTTRDSTFEKAIEAKKIASEKFSTAVETITVVTSEVREKSGDAYVVVEGFYVESKQFCSVYYDIVFETAKDTYVTLEPHIVTATETVNQLYVDNLKPVVDEKIKPVYSENLEEHVNKASEIVQAYYVEYKPIVIETWDSGVQGFKAVKLSAVSGLKEGCGALKEQAPDVEVLKVCEEETEWVVDMVLRGILVLFIMRYGFGFVRWGLWLGLWVPFRILTWPFWLFSGNKSIN